MKLLWIDAETSGFNEWEHSLLSIAGIIEEHGEVLDEFYFEIQPFVNDHWSFEAQEVHGFSLEQAMGFLPPVTAYRQIKNIFQKYVNPYKKDKIFDDYLIPCGQKVHFDIRFLSRFWEKNGDTFIGSYLKRNAYIDLVGIVNTLRLSRQLNLNEVNLASLAKHYGIEFNHHNALEDIRTTRSVFYKLCEEFKMVNLNFNY